MGNEEGSQTPLAVRKYLFWIVTGFLIYISFKILRSYIIPLISAYMLAYLVRPMFTRVKKKAPPKIAAVICVGTIALIILLPVVILITQIIQQLNNPSFSLSPLDGIIAKVQSFPLASRLNIDLIKQEAITSLISVGFTKTLSYLPSKILGIGITLFAMYYILLNWEFLSKQISSFLPFKNRDKAIEEISFTSHRIVFGYLLVAIIELVVASIGFTISGVSYAPLFAFLISILAFIPGLGPLIVWGPLAISYLISGNYFTFIGVLITGAIISIGVDTFVVANLVGEKAKINPLVLLLGILGGVPVFGIFGFIIGPIVIVYTLKLVQEGISQEAPQMISKPLV